ncbi:hypothetical protein P154DRAFT_218277 [Amniculicola lignicola CBS 123094]|uniref:Uncharacterized protein n=1 Tax=Amniculicola lignicola CBS 123094 TaxID=1392246 RepID=A0A6A5WZ83_9PLEO|nr:hypothetical protein P154DRAFT_218277 [Amniculicola lignicola CBS 123094]
MMEPQHNPVLPETTLVPFPYMDLPYIPWVIVLEQYLAICHPNTGTQSLHTSLSEEFLNGNNIYRSDQDKPCCHLYHTYGYHAKNLPLLLTNRAIHDEFRRRCYAIGSFQTRHRYDTERERTSREVWISPLRPARHKDHEFMLFKDLPLPIWNEIKYLEIELDIERDSVVLGNVAKHLCLLVQMARQRSPEQLMRKLKVAIIYPGPVQENDATPINDVYDEFGSLSDFQKMWVEVVAPLHDVEWGVEGAKEVLFVAVEESRLYEEDVGYKMETRRFEYGSWEEFEGAAWEIYPD